MLYAISHYTDKSNDGPHSQYLFEVVSYAHHDVNIFDLHDLKWNCFVIYDEVNSFSEIVNYMHYKMNLLTAAVYYIDYEIN